jgi:hypothetical protein
MSKQVPLRNIKYRNFCLYSDCTQNILGKIWKDTIMLYYTVTNVFLHCDSLMMSHSLYMLQTSWSQDKTCLLLRELLVVQLKPLWILVFRSSNLVCISLCWDMWSHSRAVGIATGYRVDDHRAKNCHISILSRHALPPPPQPPTQWVWGGLFPGGKAEENVHSLYMEN